MHAPDWVCTELERIHPWVRLGWLGEKRQSPDEELNKGSFFLLQLYHARDAALTMYCPWEDAGPVWGSRYDPLRRVPVIIQPMTTEEVCSGEVIRLLRKMMNSNITKDAVDSRAEAGKQFQQEVDDVAEASGERARHARKKLDHAVPYAKKFLTQEEKDMLSGDCDNDRLSDIYLNSTKPAVT